MILHHHRPVIMRNKWFDPQIWFAIVVFTPLAATYLCVKTVSLALDKAHTAARAAKRRFRARTRRIPRSKPLVSAERPTTTSDAIGTTSFLSLPVEIRLRIYQMVLSHEALVQPTLKRPLWGITPPDWQARQRIHAEDAAPSPAMRVIIGLGGSGLRPNPYPPRGGCVRYDAINELFPGDVDMRSYVTQNQRGSRVEHSDLLRTCRVVYAEMLDVLYGGNTVCLFGTEMVWYFIRNASPEGLPRLRFLHIALRMASDAWHTRSQRRAVEGALRMVGEKMPGLRQLHLEVVLTFGQPARPERFWSWLREVVANSFQGLDKFVLKVTVYLEEKESHPYGDQYTLSWTYYRWMHAIEKLKTWDDEEYAALKAQVTDISV